MNFQPVKNYWLSCRWGLIYVSFILSFVTASTVTYSDIPLIHSLFSTFWEYVIAGFVLGGLVVAPIIGFLHGKYQNPTDVLKSNKPLIDEIVKRIGEQK